LKKPGRFLLDVVYSSFDGSAYPFQLRPPFPAKDIKRLISKSCRARFSLFADNKDKYGRQKLFQNDVVDIAAFYWGKTVGRLLYETGTYYKHGQTEKFDETFKPRLHAYAQPG